MLITRILCGNLKGILLVKKVTGPVLLRVMASRLINSGYLNISHTCASNYFTRRYLLYWARNEWHLEATGSDTCISLHLWQESFKQHTLFKPHIRVSPSAMICDRQLRVTQRSSCQLHQMDFLNQNKLPLPMERLLERNAWRWWFNHLHSGSELALLLFAFVEWFTNSRYPN